RTAPTAASANARPAIAASSPTGPASRSDDTPPAAGSSTSTAKRPEPPDNGQPTTNTSTLTRPQSPPHDPTSTSEDVRRTPGRVSGTHTSPRTRHALAGCPELDARLHHNDLLV